MELSMQEERRRRDTEAEELAQLEMALEMSRLDVSGIATWLAWACILPSSCD